MKPQFAEFWICADPTEVTQVLKLEPTSTRINNPYSYWQLECSGEEYGVECIAALLKILATREQEIIELAAKYAVGVTWAGSLDNDMPDCENHFCIEAEEMGFLSRLAIPLCVQVWRNAP